MNTIKPPPGLRSSDFEEIEAAVMETERGRWFLAEYARRVRAEASDVLLLALCRIEDNLKRRDSDALSADQKLVRQIEAMEERLMDLVWRLKEQNADRASAFVEAEVSELRRIAGRADVSLASGADRSAIEESSPAGVLSRRLASIDRQEQAVAAPKAAPSLIPCDRMQMVPGAPFSPPFAERLLAFAGIEAMTPAERLAFFF